VQHNKGGVYKFEASPSFDGGAYWTVYADSVQPTCAFFDGPTSLIVGTRIGGIYEGTIVTNSVSGQPTIPSFDVSPNPAQNRATLRLSLERSGPVSVEIFDETGRAVMPAITSRHNKGDIRISLDLSNLPAGAYELRAKIAGSMKIQKLMIVK
jgi:hypothetical protein